METNCAHCGCDLDESLDFTIEMNGKYVCSGDCFGNFVLENFLESE